jgi:hypothetical protein
VLVLMKFSTWPLVTAKYSPTAFADMSAQWQSAVRILGISAFNEIPLSVQQDKRLAGLGIA